MQTKTSEKEMDEPEAQRSTLFNYQGVSPFELDKKLSQLFIKQQENQIEELESELDLAHSKLQEKEAELQAMKDCVRRLTQFSLSNASGKLFQSYYMKPLLFRVNLVLCGIKYLKSWHDACTT